MQRTSQSLMVGVFLFLSSASDSALGGSCNTAADCNDSNACTQDLCSAGTCSNPAEPDGTPCTDDGLFCTGPEICTSGICGSAGDPCPGLQCDEASDVCFCLADEDCDDANPCTADVCMYGVCQNTIEPAGDPIPDIAEYVKRKAIFLNRQPRRFGGLRGYRD